MRTTLSTKGRIVLPAEFRKQDGLEPGQQFVIERLGCGDYRLVLCEGPRNRGLVDWLLNCPEKGFFEGIKSESTDTL